ncbi:hypothetical protein VNO77_20447 [Canavalia gladiata]|uniref:Uncharacterized protein n=1 Tax=Canavalia gladiata TaxID=3824 RepID=A0AAN9LP89_CANGL
MVQLTLGSYSDQETSEVSRTYASVFNLSVVFSYKPRDFKDSFCCGISVVPSWKSIIMGNIRNMNLREPLCGRTSLPPPSLSLPPPSFCCCSHFSSQEETLSQSPPGL